MIGLHVQISSCAPCSGAVEVPEHGFVLPAGSSVGRAGPTERRAFGVNLEVTGPHGPDEVQVIAWCATWRIQGCCYGRSLGRQASSLDKQLIHCTVNPGTLRLGAAHLLQNFIDVAECLAQACAQRCSCCKGCDSPDVSIARQHRPRVGSRPFWAFWGGLQHRCRCALCKRMVVALHKNQFGAHPIGTC